jgi:hypothetical protein
MAMYLADLAVMATIQSGLQHLKENPDELEYILSNYVDLCMINKMTGGYKYVRMLMDVMLEKTGQQIIVDEYYTQNTQSNYAVYVISSGGESNKFFSDYGQEEQQQIEPKVYLIADAIKNKGKNKLVFLKNTGILDAVSIGMKAVISTPTGNFEAFVKEIFPDKKSLPDAPTAEGFNNSDSVTVILDKDIPIFEGKPSLKGWSFKSRHSIRTAIINASGDSVNIGVLLKTTGDIQLHKLFTLVMRYILKKGRMTLESQGLQVATITQSPPSEEGGTQDVAFTTTFSIKATAFDFWIDKKVSLPDKICLHVDGVSQDGSSIVPIYPVKEEK